jgi:hypothetical protein
VLSGQIESNDDNSFIPFPFMFGGGGPIFVAPGGGSPPQGFQQQQQQPGGFEVRKK